MRLARRSWISAIIVPFSALADPASGPSPGVWTLPTSDCEMTFQITTDNHIVRTSGTLSYTTAVAFAEEGKGWLLNEQLEEYNGGNSCRGQSAAQVTKHLETDAYIELLGDRLFYYTSRSGGRLLEFKQSSAQPGAAAGERSLGAGERQRGASQKFLE